MTQYALIIALSVCCGSLVWIMIDIYRNPGEYIMDDPYDD